MGHGLVVCFSGRMTSGKSSVSNILSEVLDWRRVGFSDHLRERLVSENVEPTREALQDLGQRLVTEQPDEFCRAVLAMGQFAPGDNLLVDGIRHRDIYDRIARLVAPSRTILIYLAVSDDDIRARGNARDHDGTALLRADQHPVEAELKDTLPASADLVVDARQSLQEVLTMTITHIAGKLVAPGIDVPAAVGRAATLAARA